MRRSELRAERRRRRKHMRERMKDNRDRLQDHPAMKKVQEERAKKRKRRNRRTLIASLLLLLLLLLLKCEVPQPGTGEGTPIAVASPEEPVTFGARTKTQKRPGYSVPVRPGPTWLDEFRLQVAARSPRLSTCFNGTDRSGALRWTTSIDAKTGAVTGHEFEPLGATTITAEQKRCATVALSEPGYRLRDPPSEKLPNRVSLVLEF